MLVTILVADPALPHIQAIKETTDGSQLFNYSGLHHHQGEPRL